MRHLQAARGTPLTPPVGSVTAWRALGLFAWTASVVLLVDLATKVWVVERLGSGTVRLFGGALLLRQTRNPGAAFSVGSGATVLLTAIALTVAVVIVRAARRLRSLPWAVVLGLLLGGACGNLADRLFRAPGPFRGAVIDWVDVQVWPVFNVADTAIVCGGALALLLSGRGLRLDGSRDGGEDAGAGDTEA